MEVGLGGEVDDDETKDRRGDVWIREATPADVAVLGFVLAGCLGKFEDRGWEDNFVVESDDDDGDDGESDGEEEESDSDDDDVEEEEEEEQGSRRWVERTRWGETGLPAAELGRKIVAQSRDCCRRSRRRRYRGGITSLSVSLAAAAAAGAAAAAAGEGGGGGASTPSSLLPRRERDLPAVTAACCVLARSLATNGRLRALGIDGRRFGAAGEAEAEAEAVASPSSAAVGGERAETALGSGRRGRSARPEEHRLWGLVAGEFSKSLRRNDTCEVLRLALPRGHLSRDDARGIVEAAEQGPLARRKALLSAAHPRCCNRNRDGNPAPPPPPLPLSNLPVDVMAAIADLGIRRRACVVDIVEGDVD